MGFVGANKKSGIYLIEHCHSNNRNLTKTSLKNVYFI
jgi:hypothetical protein